MGISKIITEDVSLYDFEAWSGGEDGKNEIIEAGVVTEFENYVNEIYPEGCTDTELNDLLWFEVEVFFEDYMNYVRDKNDNWVDPSTLEDEEDEDDDEDEESEDDNE